MGVGPVRCSVEATGHVQPFNDDVAVEIGRIGWTANDGAGLVVSSCCGLDRPVAVSGQRLRWLIGRRFSTDEEL